MGADWRVSLASPRRFLRHRSEGEGENSSSKICTVSLIGRSVQLILIGVSLWSFTVTVLHWHMRRSNE